MRGLLGYLAVLSAAVLAFLAAQYSTVELKELAVKDLGTWARDAGNVALCPLKITGQLLSLRWPPT